MGVKGLWKVLARAEERVGLQDLKDSVLAIDAAIWLVPRGIRAFFYRLRNLIKAGVTPLVVFDGSIPQRKLSVVAERRKRKLCQDSNISLASMEAKYEEQIQRGNNSTVMQMLKSMGVPYVQSVGEGDKVCAFLNKEGIVDGVISEDSDVLVYGARVVYHQFSTVSGSISKRICSERVLQKCGLNHYSLIALAVQVGCDFLPSGFTKIGMVTALHLIRKAKLKTKCNLLQFLKEHCHGIHENTIEGVVNEFISSPRIIGMIDTELHVPRVSSFLQFSSQFWKWPLKDGITRLASVMLRWHLEGHNIEIPEVEIRPLTVVSYTNRLAKNPWKAPPRLNKKSFHIKGVSAKGNSRVTRRKRAKGHSQQTHLKVCWEVKYKEVRVKVVTIEAKQDLEAVYKILPV